MESKVDSADAAKWNAIGRLLPTLMIAVAIVIFGFSLERAAKHIDHGLDNFGYPSSGWLHSGNDFPRDITIHLEDKRGK
jgi:hypothetical protein